MELRYVGHGVVNGPSRLGLAQPPLAPPSCRESCHYFRDCRSNGRNNLHSNALKLSHFSTDAFERSHPLRRFVRASETFCGRRSGASIVGAHKVAIGVCF